MIDQKWHDYGADETRERYTYGHDRAGNRTYRENVVAAGSNFDEVQVAPINSDGTLGAFTATNPLPSTRQGSTSVAYNGYLYVIGGLDSSHLDDVQVATINADGTLGAFAPTTIECYGMRTGSAAHNSTWNLRVEGPPGPSSPWNTAGADGVPTDHTSTLGASVTLTNTAQLYVWETGPALTLATEWAAGNGTEQQGMLCLNTDPTASNICSPFSNGAPKIEVTYGPALP